MTCHGMPDPVLGPAQDWGMRPWNNQEHQVQRPGEERFQNEANWGGSQTMQGLPCESLWEAGTTGKCNQDHSEGASIPI